MPTRQRWSSGWREKYPRQVSKNDNAANWHNLQTPFTALADQMTLVISDSAAKADLPLGWLGRLPLCLPFLLIAKANPAIDTKRVVLSARVGWTVGQVGIRGVQRCH